MSDDPKSLARAVVLDSLRNDVQLFVAMQYLGLIRQEELHAEFREELASTITLVATDEQRVEMVNQQPVMEPVRLPIRRFERHVEAEQLPPRRSSKERKLFAMWMEKEIPWSPAVMGWDEDDPRVEGMRAATAREVIKERDDEVIRVLANFYETGADES